MLSIHQHLSKPFLGAGASRRAKLVGRRTQPRGVCKGVEAPHVKGFLELACASGLGLWRHLTTGCTALNNRDSFSVWRP